VVSVCAPHSPLRKKPDLGPTRDGFREATRPL
jgi:hypothetical protein